MQSTQPNFPSAQPVASDETPRVLSFSQREKALAALHSRERILALVHPQTPELVQEFAHLRELLDQIAFCREPLWREDPGNDRQVDPPEITIAGIRYTLTAHQFLANGRKPRPGGKFPLRLYLCGACDLVIWPYPAKYCNDACRSEYWQHRGR